MKKIVKQLFFFSLLVAFFASCKKDENQLVYSGGTAPVLTASSTTAKTLDSTLKNTITINFSWTNPNYQFNTGVSSQDVTYFLQVDTTGANFTSPLLQQVSISKDLSVSFTVKELNTILTKLNLNEDMPHNMEFRIKSTLINGSVPLYSNVVKITITPYLDVALPLPPEGHLYITGSGTPSGWTNDPPIPVQKCTKVSKTEYYIVMDFSPGLQYKFLDSLTKWQPQYGKLLNSNGDGLSGDLGYNFGGGTDPDAIPTPSASGTYKVTLNFKTGKYNAVKQ